MTFVTLITVYGDGQQARCFCDVTDAVRALLALAECPTAVGQLFNIGGTAFLGHLTASLDVASNGDFCSS